MTRSAGIDPSPATGHQKGRREPEEEPQTEQQGSYGLAEPASPRRILDVANIMGIPTEELTPHVREALTIIISEFDRVRHAAERDSERAEHFKELSEKDCVLPVLNRRAFARELSRIIIRSAQTETTSSVAVIHFLGVENIRLVHGREIADKTLEQVARTLADALRTTDIVAHIGGSDFAVILTLTDRNDGLQTMKEVRDAMRTRLISRDGTTGFDLVWGLVDFDSRADADQLLVAADDDLRRRWKNSNPGGSGDNIRR
ncbi:MAG: diguanylate cyclase [Rhodospirillales bacterium]|nr:diguanylate cyclase [Rhodospirillales bacterium]